MILWCDSSQRDVVQIYQGGNPTVVGIGGVDVPDDTTGAVADGSSQETLSDEHWYSLRFRS